MNTRGYRIYFYQPVYNCDVHALNGSRWDGTRQDVYRTPPEGVTTHFMRSRSWDGEFEVEVTLGPESIDPAPPLGGKLVCECSEYLSGIAGAGKVGRPDKEGRILAFKVIVGSLLKWVVAMKAVDGLVRAFHFNVTELLNILVDSCSSCCLPFPYTWALSCITLEIVNMLYMALSDGLPH